MHHADGRPEAEGPRRFIDLLAGTRATDATRTRIRPDTPVDKGRL